MARSTPLVRDAALAVRQADGGYHSIAIGSPEWYGWLSDEAHRSFAFESPQGKFTARKERKQYGGWYWVAYRQAEGILHKVYAGKPEDLSPERLLAVAVTLTGRTQQGIARQQFRRVVDVPLLATKLAIPPPRPQMLLRPRLIERLEEGLSRKLTLLSAPAGFGKTTLLSAWLGALAGQGMPVAWVSLDPQDNDPMCFWSYLLAAINRAAPGVGDQALALLRTAQPPRLEAVLGELINALAASAGDLVLALDDYQVIEEPIIHSSLAWLLSQLPPRSHLALASRTYPPFPLARLRALGQLVELRAAELRFTAEETAAFFTQVMKLDLPAPDLALLGARNEGWVAGLQLVALALQGRQNGQDQDVIAAFSSSNASIRDYLVEEVLSQQSAEAQAFLLQTSLLTRLSGPLCQSVTGQRASQALLCRLEQEQLFLLPLDAERQWYRYHPLFAEALRTQLQNTYPDLLPALHQRAAAWYAGAGQADEAIAHLLAIPDYAGAARLIGKHAQAALMAGQFQTLLSWLKALPDGILRAHPRLFLYHAWALLFTGQFGAALTRLQDGLTSSQLLKRSMDEDAQRLVDEAAALAGLLGVFHGGSLPPAELGLESPRWPAGDRLLQSLAALSLGFQRADDGDGDSASYWLSKAFRLSAGQGNLLVPVLALCQLAEVQMVQGSLRRAAASYRRAQRLASDQQGRPLPIAGMAFIGLGLLLREWNDLEAAARHILSGIDLCAQWGDLWALDGYLALARVYGAQGMPERAQQALQEAGRIAQQLESDAFLSHVAATQAKNWLAQGNVEAAARWADDAGLSVDGTLSAEDEPAYLLFARLLLAQGQSDLALKLLVRLLPSAEKANRHGRVIEMLALQAVGLHAQNEIPQAFAALERALKLAAPAGYQRLFVELGAPMAALLRQARSRAILPDYVGKLLAAFIEPTSRSDKHNGAALPPASSPALYQTLTPREQEVLRLLAAGSSNGAIAAELVVTVGTVKKHLHNLFCKLQVESRTQAIIAARTLNLV